MSHFRFDSYPYFPALRTRSAELKGLQQLAIEQRAAMLPLLTLGRWPRSNDFLRSAERAAEVMQGAPYCLDLTHDGNHLPEAQQQLRNPARGYETWRQFVARWPQAIAVMQLNPEARLHDWVLQARLLESQAEALAFRITDFAQHTPLVMQALCALDRSQNAIVFLDCQYIRGQMPSYVSACRVVINQLRTEFPDLMIVVMSTSFPSSVVNFADASQSAGSIDILERELHAQLGGCTVAAYGDHGSIHSVVYDETSPLRWAARIDYPHELCWDFARSPKDQSVQGYVRAAQAIVTSDPHLGSRGLWGEHMILRAAQGQPHGAAPVSWIAVRVNLHLARQLAWSQRLRENPDQGEEETDE